MAEDSLIGRLGKLDTCAVSDALDRLSLKGASFGVRPLWPCPRIVGRAVTVKIKPAGLEKPKQHLGSAAIQAARAGDIIVIDSGGRPEDRKSTRLNSSHLVISYAVFCLKKKKKRNYQL